uniref:Uncharacterized protein n=1 Tax=Brassica campestris TaxID=3711 RepID=M4EK19_BRACM
MNGSPSFTFVLFSPALRALEIRLLRDEFFSPCCRRVSELVGARGDGSWSAATPRYSEDDMGIPGIRGNEENLTSPWSSSKVENSYVVPKIIKSELAECAGFGGRAKLILAICKLGFEIDLVIQTVYRETG